MTRHSKRSTSILFAYGYVVRHTRALEKAIFPETLFTSVGTKAARDTLRKVLRTRRQLYEDAGGEGKGIEKPTTSRSSLGRFGGAWREIYSLFSPLPPQFQYSHFRRYSIFRRFLLLSFQDLWTMELNMLSMLYFLLLLSLPSMGLFFYLRPL